MPTLRDVGEIEAIRRLTGARRTAERSGVVVGSGDDAAVLRPAAGCDLVATTDAFVEGRHYDPGRFTPVAIGARLATANLSDLAAMAATPRWALLSIGARAEHDLDALIATQAALDASLAAEGAGVVGGNLVAVEGAEWLSLTLFGEVARDRAWTRHGARPGDAIAVTGLPGRAGAAVAIARALDRNAAATEWTPLLDAWLAPRARVGVARALAESGGVTAAIDVSDGLAGDLARLCEASGTGAELDEPSASDDPLLARAAGALGVSLESLRFGPSDDYELLLAIDPARLAACEAVARAAGSGLSTIGRITPAGDGLTVRGPSGTRALAVRGFDHFGTAQR